MACFRDRAGYTYMNIPQDREEDYGFGTFEVPSTQAKKDYFLTTGDLTSLPFLKEPGFFGCGPGGKYFRQPDLAAAAILKHGKDGYAKKIAAREKRERNKRAREQAAADADAELRGVGGMASVKKARVDGRPAAAGATAADLAPLRRCLRALLRKNMRFTESGAPGSFRLDVPNVSKAQFAALAGRPHDPALVGMTKSGAYFKANVDVPTLLGDDAVISGHVEDVALRVVSDSIALSYMERDCLLKVYAHCEFDGW